MTAVYGGTVIAVEGTYDDVNRLCAELTSERPSWAFVNVNVRTYYAEGSKTLAFEIAEQLGWQAPDHVVVPDRLGQPADQGGQGLRRAGQGRPAARGARRAGLGRPGRGVLARWPPPSPRAPTPSGRSSPRPSPSRWPSATRPTAGTPSRPCARSGGVVRRGDRRRGHRGHRAAGPDRGHLRRDRRRGDHRHPVQAGRLGGHPPRRAGGGPGHRARPQDGRGPDRRGRARAPTATIAPTLDAFDAAVDAIETDDHEELPR